MLPSLIYILYQQFPYGFQTFFTITFPSVYPFLNTYPHSSPDLILLFQFSFFISLILCYIFLSLGSLSILLILKYLEFGGLGNLLGDDFSNSIYLPEIFIILFFSISEYYPIVYMYIFIIHSSVDSHVGSFQILLTVNTAVVNIDDQAQIDQEHR